MNAEPETGVENQDASVRASGAGMLRLAYLTNISTPYRIEMVEAWARLNPRLQITVYYTDSDDQGRGWKTRQMQGVNEHKLRRLVDVRGFGKLNCGLWDLVNHNDLIMIGGFEQLSYLVSAAMAKFRHKPVILLFDGFSPARFTTERFWVKGIKRLTAWLADVYFANGTVGRQYLQNILRVSENKPIHNQFLSHANHSIEAARKRLAAKSKHEIRAELQIDTGGMVLLSCGYLIRRKRNDLVIEAISRMPHERRPLLLIVGTGPLEEALAEQAKAYRVPVHFVGFKQQEKLADYYFAADALVLASEDDPWGLVVNEAMSAGLPVLVSDACGASLDLVREGVNGFTFRSGSVADLSRAIGQLEEADCSVLGAQSESLIRNWTSDQSARSLANCVEYALEENHDRMRMGEQ
jgi:glycosyltransferase involved in cell wall biosynthesis